MKINRRDFMQLAGIGLPSIALANALGSHAHAAGGVPVPFPDEINHVLNRISFGIKPADWSDAVSGGIDEYIRQQVYQLPPQDDEMEFQLQKQYPEAYLPRKAMVDFYFAEAKVGLPFKMPREFKPYTEGPEQMYRAGMEMGGSAVGIVGAVPLPREVESQSRRRRPGKALTALREMTCYRALRNPHQLYEVMVEFWGNHFSIDASSHPNLYVHKLLDDREVIRPYAMTDFRTLLHASARSTAMLYYLDGVSNVSGRANENYARELMELHTIGVDGGYKHEDVLEVARCFTGWTIDPDTADFTFDPSKHDDGEKTVLGQTIPPGGGIEDGNRVLNMLISHPATARRIATKLVRRFVSDQPPSSLVERVEAAFGKDGDVKAMLNKILYSPEFRQARDEKVKRPIHFTISALRATNASIGTDKLFTLTYHLKRMGQLPYNWPMPDGYPDEAGYWISTNSLMYRWQYGLVIGKGGGQNIAIDMDELIGGATTARTLVETLRANVLRRELSDDDRNNIVAYAAEGGDPDKTLSSNKIKSRAYVVLGLMLNSAYFQRG